MRSRGVYVWIIVTAAMVVVSGCHGNGPGADSPDQAGVIAVYDGGVVTRDDFDTVVLAKPAADRVPDEGAGAWVRTVVEDIILERVLMADPEIDDGPIEEQIAGQRTDELHKLAVEAFLKRHLPAAEPVSEAEALQEYEANRQDWVQSPRREVSNIFLQTDSEHPMGKLSKTAAEIRQRFEQGESFGDLAAQYSASETRHSGGYIGWIRPDQITPAVAKVIFSLDQGRLSEPIRADNGLHLFLVSGIIDGKDFSFSDVRQTIVGRMAAERRQEKVTELADSLPDVPGAYVLSGDVLLDLVRDGDPQAEVLRIGEVRLTVGQFRQILARSKPERGLDRESLPGRLLETIARRERIYAAAVREGLDELPEVEKRLDSAMDEARLRLRRKAVVERTVDADPELLRTWFDANQNRFSTPLRLEISRLVVPLNDSVAASVMNGLEELSRSSVSGESLQEVANRLGGQVVDQGWTTVEELASIRPMAARLAVKTKRGHLSAPYRTATTLESLYVSGREEPAVQPLAAVYDHARAVYLESHATEIYGRWAKSVLEGADVRVFPERLGGDGAGRSESPDG